MKKIVNILLPLILVGLTIYTVSFFGNDVGTILLGIAMLYYFYISKTNTRKYMILLGFFASMFETANVAIGAYSYSNAELVPLWISLGWAILGWWTLNINQYIKINEKLAMTFTVLVMLVVSVISNQSLITVPLAITGLWMISQASKFRFSFFMFAFLIALFLEISGIYFGLWTYATETGAPQSWVMLGMSYSFVLGVTLWLSGIKKESDIEK